MASHSFHPDSHQFGLADNCERCAEHAEHPWSTLDRENLENVVCRAVNHSIPCRSENEAVAVANVLTAMERFGAIAAAAPDEALAYLGRWRVTAVQS